MVKACFEKIHVQKLSSFLFDVELNIKETINELIINWVKFLLIASSYSLQYLEYLNARINIEYLSGLR